MWARSRCMLPCGRRARLIRSSDRSLRAYTHRQRCKNKSPEDFVMHQAKELIAAGRIDEATASLLDHVKANPNDAASRTFLFELSCLAGNWDRAERQLDVIGHQSTEAQLGVMVYRANINAERERQRVFAEGVPPHFLREPPAYVDLCVEALKQASTGQLTAARATL